MKGTADEYLKMSVLNAMLALKEYKASYPEKTLGELVEIIKNVGNYQSSFDYTCALDYLNHAVITSIPDLRSIITDILMRMRPSWMHTIPFGREVVASSLFDNEKFDALQCLQSAGLYMDEPDSEVVSWWDQLASQVRSDGNDSRLESGRKGELLTLEYEKERLRGEIASPKWISIENNFAGYDVLSYVADSTGIRQKLIEVKACKSHPISFYISKNEWNSALRFGSNYVFHIWYLPTSQLLELTISDVAENIPVDQGTGQWQSVYIDIDDVFRKQVG